MNIYEVQITVHKGKKKVSFPYLVAETTGMNARAKAINVFRVLTKTEDMIKISAGKVNCIISNH